MTLPDLQYRNAPETRGSAVACLRTTRQHIPASHSCSTTLFVVIAMTKNSFVRYVRRASGHLSRRPRHSVQQSTRSATRAQTRHCTPPHCRVAPLMSMLMRCDIYYCLQRRLLLCLPQTASYFTSFSVSFVILPHFRPFKHVH